MTNITIKDSKDKVIIDLIGHAGYNPGNDVVCAAVSILTYTLLNELANSDVPFKHEISPGKVHIEIEQRIPAVQTVLTGWKLLENNYPDNVKITLGK
jgi:uncharacterized protein YsxB (DUF464 family)